MHGAEVPWLCVVLAQRRAVSAAVAVAVVLPSGPSSNSTTLNVARFFAA